MQKNEDMLQFNLLLKAKKFISSFNNLKCFPKKNNNFYLASYSKSIDLYTLRSFANLKQSFLKHTYIILKDVFYGMYYLNYESIKPRENINYKKIVISWAFKNNFNKDGSFNDRYFNINSNIDNKILWYLVYMDKQLPKKIAKNVALFQPIKFKKLDFKYVIKNIFSKIHFIFKNYKYFLADISSNSTLAEIISNDFNKYLNKKLNNVLMPFESQPFQNQIIENIRNYNKKIKTTGYIHSPPLALPTNFIYKSGCPDKIILNGVDQLNCFVKYLGWKKKNLKVLASDRFFKGSKDLSNIIFLPISIISINNIIKSIKYLLKEKKLNLNNFEIKNHPASKFSEIHKKLTKEIKKIIYKNNNKNKKRNKFSIFVGTSGAIIEALEKKNSVLQICEEPAIDMYSSKIWQNIKKEKITDNIYKYSLKKRGSMIKLGKKSKNLNHYFA